MVEAAGTTISSTQDRADASDFPDEEAREQEQKQDRELISQNHDRDTSQRMKEASPEPGHGHGHRDDNDNDNDDGDGEDDESREADEQASERGSAGKGLAAAPDSLRTADRGEDEAIGGAATSSAGTSTSAGAWNPANAKVFDVYMDNGSSQTSQLLDIFACENNQREASAVNLKRKSTEDSLELYNSGTGERSHGFLDKINDKKFKVDPSASDRKQLNSLTLPIVKLEPQQHTLPRAAPQLQQVPYGLSNGPPHSAPVHGEMLTAFGQTDKWPSKMESAFIAALRIIIKNGTSKFKILEKNYGRNELISLFVQYHTGEVRTKKQISSHIQVWKKSISNKISSNFKVNPLDEEILQLIEEGAPQSNDSIKMFYGCFEEIVATLSKQSQNLQNRGSTARDPMQHYPYLISPAQSATNPVASYTQADILQQHQHQQHQQHQHASQPATPLDYAKSIYGSLKTYKCVPVKVQDQVSIHQDIQQQQQPHQPHQPHHPHHPHQPQQSQPQQRQQQQPQPQQPQQPQQQQLQQQSATRQNNSIQPPPTHASQQQHSQPVYIHPAQKNYSVPHSILQSAKDLEYQQRQLIENLSHNQSQFKLPSVSPNLYIRNLQPPTMPAQQNAYHNTSQPIVSGPMPHYPAAYHQLQHSGEQVPAGLVLPPHKYYQQPQIYVPVSAPPRPSNNTGNDAGLDTNHMQVKDAAQQQLQRPSSGSFSPATTTQNTHPQGREYYQLNRNKN